jgi:hypothetical protein
MTSAKSCLTAFFLINTLFIYAQNLNLQDFNARRIKDSKTDMLLLGSWAVGNMAVSGILLGNAKGVAKGYHRMNIGWNAVNLTIAGFGYFAALKSNPASFDLYGTIDEHYKIQKLFLFNAGLDVGYMAAGAWLTERSKNTNKDPLQMKGFGRAIIVNGAFLFAFDLANYFIQAGHNDKVKLLLSGNGLGLSLKL